ncbi:MAG TPA: glycosyltransferase family 2 protein [Chromatiaceae bacterium]|nr:glycosyltransferase family 2 protein [Chromatiaceae bacterium]
MSVCAVVVAYHPDIAALRKLSDNLHAQGATVIVVDNTPPQSARVPRPALDARWLSQGGNSGIASAHNRGIEAALAAGHAHVLLMDQDSQPAADMLARLLAAEQALLAAGQHVAAVAPVFEEPRQRVSSHFIRLQGWRIRKVHCRHADEHVAADYVISSGCLIRAETLREVGPMEDALFIDYVDIEWGLRALSRGYRSFGVCAARMLHELGEAPAGLPFSRRKRYPVHSPLRHYYHFRNALLLYRRDYVPIAWKFNDGWRLLLKFGFYSLMTPPRLAHFRMMLLGVWHGLRGRAGALRAE